MKQRDQNSINMWRVVISYLDARSSVWESNEFFSDIRTELGDALQEAEAALQAQVLGSLGVTLGKEAIEQQAVREAFSVAKAARAYALHKGDNALAASVDITKSELLRLPDAELLARLRNLLQAAQPFAAQLQQLGLESLQPAVDAVNRFAEVIANPRAAISERSHVTAQLPRILKKGRIALEKMDNLVHLFDTRSPGFSSGFKPCRLTVDAGHRYEAPRPS